MAPYVALQGLSRLSATRCHPCHLAERHRGSKADTQYLAMIGYGAHFWR